MPELTAEHDVSRRRILAAAAWATPAVMIATAAPSAASSGETAPAPDPLASSTITSVVRSGNQDVVTAQIALPAGTSISGVSVVVYWSANANSGASVALSMQGVTWSPASETARPASFTTTATLSGSKVLTVTITKGIAQASSDFTIVVNGYANGSTTLSQVALAGEYPR